MKTSRWILVVAALALAGCGQPPPENSPPPAAAPVESPAESPTRGTRVLVMGDSLTAGYGLETAQAFPARLEARLEAAGFEVDVTAAGVSGDTTAGGLRRLPWSLERVQPAIVVLALGANDGLRGLDPEETERNLRQMIELSRAEGRQVLLCGMRLPTSHGADYVDRFEAIYPRLTREFDMPLVPFLLEGVAGNPGLNLDDGIHPNPSGHEVIAELLVDHLRPLLQRGLAG